MTVEPLSELEVSQTGFTHRVVITLADLTAAGLTQTIQVFPNTGNAPAGLIADAGALRTVTTFTGPSLTSVSVSIGDAGSATRNCASTNVTSAAYFIPAWTRSMPYPTSDAVKLAFTSVGCNLNALTAGQLEVYLRLLPAYAISR